MRSKSILSLYQRDQLIIGIIFVLQGDLTGIFAEVYENDWRLIAIAEAAHQCKKDGWTVGRLIDQEILLWIISEVLRVHEYKSAIKDSIGNEPVREMDWAAEMNFIESKRNRTGERRDSTE